MLGRHSSAPVDREGEKTAAVPRFSGQHEEGAAVEPGKSGTPLFHVVEIRDATPQRAETNTLQENRSKVCAIASWASMKHG
jgi:hypothetical protein